MLQAMQQCATTEPSPTFAGVLAAFTAPEQKRPPVRDLEGLEDDVVVLSYDRALRAHSRFKSTDSNDPTPAPVSRPQLLRIVEVFPFVQELAVEAAPSVAQPKPAIVPDNSTAHERNLKSASITIRLSRAECAQLRQRAAEAGLTISAYLRSCAVEAESLRAQVMDTLAQMRAEKLKEDPVASADAGRRWFDWVRWLWPHAHADRSIAQF
jgi:hypothetical protein